MADPSLKSRREDPVHQLHAEAEPGASFRPERGDEEPVIDLGPYLRIVWARRQMIALCTLAGVLLTVLVTVLFLHQWYRAIAILRPVPKAATAGRIAGMFGAGGATALSPFMGLMGGAVGP